MARILIQTHAGSWILRDIRAVFAHHGITLGRRESLIDQYGRRPIGIALRLALVCIIGRVVNAVAVKNGIQHDRRPPMLRMSDRAAAPSRGATIVMSAHAHVIRTGESASGRVSSPWEHDVPLRENNC